MDFASRAAPVLKEFDAPATLYLTTYYCKNRLPVFDTALAYLLWRGRGSGADLRYDLDADTPVRVTESHDRAFAWETIQKTARRRELDGKGKNELLGALARWLGIDLDTFLASGLLQLMTPEQVLGLPRDLIDIELHTHRHRTPRDEPRGPRNGRASAPTLPVSVRACTPALQHQAAREHVGKRAAGESGPVFSELPSPRDCPTRPPRP